MNMYAEIIKKIEQLEKECSEIKSKKVSLLEEVEKFSNEVQLLIESKEQLEKAAIVPNETTALIEELKNEIETLKKELEYTKRIAYVDEKFGTNNFNAFSERFYKKKEDAVAVAVVDVKDMRMINQEFDEEVGDNVISLTLNVLNNMFGAANVYRIGGARFTILLKEGTCSRINSMLKIVRDELYTEHDIEVTYGFSMVEGTKNRETFFHKANADSKKEKKYTFETTDVKEFEKKETEETTKKEDVVVNPNIMSSIYDDLYSEAENIIEVDATSIDVAREIIDMQKNKK